MKFIRWKALIPFLLVAALIYVFAVYYMDRWLRLTLMEQGSRINGAFVEIDSLRLSFLQSRLVVQGIQATDSEDLMRNRFEINSVVADLKFLSLLKKKVVIENATVGGVQWSTPRKKPGRIPKAWLSKWKKEEKEEDGFLAQTVESLKSEIASKLPDFDLEKLGKKFDPRNIVKLEELESYQLASGLPKGMKDFAVHLKTDGQKLIQEKKAELANLRRQIESLDPRKVQSLQDILSSIQRVQKLKAELEAQRNSVKTAQRKLFSDVKGKFQEIASIREKLKGDIEHIKSKIGFGKLNIDRFSHSILGLSIIDRYKTLVYYYEKYRPILVGKKEDQIVIRKRAKGRTVLFPITDQTPKFLLSKLHLSSDTRENKTVPGNVRGFFQAEAKDVTTDLELLGRPTQITLLADFPNGVFSKAELGLGLKKANGILDTNLNGKVSGYGLRDVTLGEQSIFPIPLKNGMADWSLNVHVRDQKMKAQAQGDFSGLAYAFAKEKGVHPLVKILREIMQTIRAFDVEVIVQGEIKKPKLAIRSSFDQALKNGVLSLVKDKVRKAQAKAEAFVRKEVEERIAQAQKLLNQKKKELESLYQAQLNRVQQVENLAKSKLEELKRKQEAKLREKIPTDKLKKDLKDGFKKTFKF